MGNPGESTEAEFELACTQRHLTARDLAVRWRVSERTLQRWRRAGCGPAFLCLGRRVAYSLEDVEAHERSVRIGGEA